MGTVVDVHGLSCLHRICNLLRAGIEPMSLPLAGRFLTTGREVLYELFKKKNFFNLFLAVLGLGCCTSFFSSCGKQGYTSLQRVGSSLK